MYCALCVVCHDVVMLAHVERRSYDLYAFFRSGVRNISITLMEKESRVKVCPTLSMVMIFDVPRVYVCCCLMFG